MKAFNPEKELYKIQHRNKNKIIFTIIFGIILLTIGYSFALYQVRYSKRIIYTKVAPFSDKDIELAVYLDGVKQSDVPEKGKAYYDNIECDNDPTASAKWDYDKWKLIEFEVSVPNKCNINFTKNYRDKSGANKPELYQGLIPVIFGDNGKVIVANTDSAWYDYGAKHWANAILVDSSNYSKYVENGEYQDGVEISMEDILQMYVWIPRYKYQLFNVNNESITPQEIKIQFENNVETTGTAKCSVDTKGRETCTGVIKEAWYTHPAFKFGNTDLTGIWVSKFEVSGSENNLTIKPSMGSLKNINVKTMFDASRNIEEQYADKFNLKEEEIDTHMMKNMEWGAVAYLTHSKYGRCDDGQCSEVAMNGTYTTGYAGTSYPWNTTTGVGASTTENTYGIYDLNGGSYEYVMGNMVNTSGVFYSSNAGFTSAPTSKYYDLYEYSTSEVSHQRGHLGDATRETLKKFGSNVGGWYDDFAYLPQNNLSWFRRGGSNTRGVNAGTFTFGRAAGAGDSDHSFRVVLTQQDGTN